MSIDTRHPSYAGAAAKWERVSIVLEGADAIKASPLRWIPKPAGMSRVDYDNYVVRTSFLPAAARTLSAFMGEIGRRDPEINLPSSLELRLDNIDGRATPLAQFALHVAESVIAFGRHALLVDIDGVNNTPHVASFDAGAVINWQSGWIGGKFQPTLVVLHEPVQRPKETNRFATETVDRYRLLELLETSDGPAYVVTILEKRPGEREAVPIGPPVAPVRRGSPLRSIPIIFVNATDLSPEIGPVPLLGLADLNLTHTILSADLMHSLHFAGTPMYGLIGRQLGAPDEGGEFLVGPGTLVNVELGGDIKLIESSAESVGALRQGLRDVESQMARVGARFLEPERSAAPEHHESTAMRFKAEDSTLAGVSKIVSRAMTKALRVMDWWQSVGVGSPEASEASLALNDDFAPGEMSSDELKAWVAAWQTGAIGGRAFHAALVRNEALPETLRDYEEYVADREDAGVGAAFMGSSFESEDR